MKREDVICCSFQNWYQLFEDITIKSIVLPISPETLSYLQDNGTLVLPSECNQDDEDDDWNDDSSEESFPVNLDEFSRKIGDAIAELGHKVFPKLNWSSPKDAAWISFNKSLECLFPRDVYLLLKSSDFVSRDLTSPFKGCDDSMDEEEKVDYSLVLRKWVEINPSDEFRVFVKNGQLVGISQREISQYYAYISNDRNQILRDILTFWQDNIRDEFPLSNYVFDVFRPRSSEVVLIDFSPFGETVDALLFTWEELSCKEDEGSSLVETISDPEPEFRYIAESIGVQPSPYMRYGLPLDVVDLSKEDMSNLSNFIQNNMNMEEKESEVDISDESSLR